MFPTIRQYPSNAFYEGKIKDGDSVLTRELSLTIENLAKNFGRVVFFDLINSREQIQDLSKVNLSESKFTFNLIQSLITLSGNAKQGLSSLKKNIGVVTPYKGQVRLLRTELEEKHLKSFKCQARDININTVDAFQGQEKEIIIFNCVRSNNNDWNIRSKLGFLTDLRRLNVAITRPKHFLFIIGNSRTLEASNVWGDMIRSYYHKQSQDSYFRVDENYFDYSEQVILNLL